MFHTCKKWCICCIVSVLVLLLIMGGTVAVVDPYFHYHRPLKELSYRIYNERYQNDGILRHFTYDAVIIGTSMTENFKTSELDQLFQVHAVKVPFSGASYKEINDRLKTAFQRKRPVKMVVRGLDCSMLLDSPDKMNYDGSSYPEYLYDDRIFNDVNYILNKEVFVQMIQNVFLYTRSGAEMTSFDSYANWNESMTFGKEAVDLTYTRREEKEEEKVSFTDQDRENVRENITQNVIELASENPDTEFYLFFTPYSIYYWDAIDRNGTINRYLEAEQYAISLLLKQENIHLFSFFTEFGMICDLNNYKDVWHYSEEVNSQILQWMKEGEHELNQQNCEAYYAEMREFYLNYDYDSLFEKQ